MNIHLNYLLLLLLFSRSIPPKIAHCKKCLAVLNYSRPGTACYTLYQERAVFGKMKMDPAKRAQTQNAGEVSYLQWFFSQSVELMTDKIWLHCIRPMLLHNPLLI
jgi:hypothetical protein